LRKAAERGGPRSNLLGQQPIQLNRLSRVSADPIRAH
jgi:hypothetical protein